jgi:hypothetical protein
MGMVHLCLRMSFMARRRQLRLFLHHLRRALRCSLRQRRCLRNSALVAAFPLHLFRSMALRMRFLQCLFFLQYLPFKNRR